MRVSTGYKVNTKPTRIHVWIFIYNTKPTRNGRVLTGGFGRVCGFAGTIAIPNRYMDKTVVHCSMTLVTYTQKLLFENYVRV